MSVRDLLVDAVGQLDHVETTLTSDGAQPPVEAPVALTFEPVGPGAVVLDRDVEGLNAPANSLKPSTVAFSWAPVVL